ncbi:hypothetical protein RFI_29723, partial [Reticulomyxa filosa]
KKESIKHWLDKSKKENGGTFDNETVEEVKQIYKVFPFALYQISYYMVTCSLPTFLIAQGCQMDYNIKGFAIPVALISIGDILIILILIPILEKKIYPYLQKYYKCKITTLKRTIIGYFFAIITMIIAGIVEIKRKNSNTIKNRSSKCDDNIPVHNFSLFYLFIISCLLGMSEVFTNVAGLEYFYTDL